MRGERKGTVDQEEGEEKTRTDRRRLVVNEILSLTMVYRDRARTEVAWRAQNQGKKGGFHDSECMDEGAATG